MISMWKIIRATSCSNSVNAANYSKPTSYLPLNLMQLCALMNNCIPSEEIVAFANISQINLVNMELSSGVSVTWKRHIFVISMSTSARLSIALFLLVKVLFSHLWNLFGCQTETFLVIVSLRQLPLLRNYRTKNSP